MAIVKITQAEIIDFDSIMDIIRNASAEMLSNGIDQWDDIYPDQESIKKNINNNETYILYSDDNAAAVITLNTFQDQEYDAVSWNGTNPLIIHRLCVHPNYAGKGNAKTLMAFAENHASRNGFDSIRLDAFAQNPIALKLYRNLKFTERGSIVFRKGIFICFEKAIKNDI